MSEMTMVERVARELLKAHYERGRGIVPRWESLDRFGREMWLISARAAIAAMREPTEAMLVAVDDKFEVACGYLNVGVYGGKCGEIWTAMIDEALR